MIDDRWKCAAIYLWLDLDFPCALQLKPYSFIVFEYIASANKVANNVDLNGNLWDDYENQSHEKI